MSTLKFLLLGKDDVENWRFAVFYWLRIRLYGPRVYDGTLLSSLTFSGDFLKGLTIGTVQ